MTKNKHGKVKLITFEPPHTDEINPTTVRRAERKERKREEKEWEKYFGETVKNLIYFPDSVKKQDIESLVRHIKKRVYNKFIKIQDRGVYHVPFDPEDLAQSVLTSMYAPDGFFNHFRAMNPDPEKVTVEEVWWRFSHRTDERIKKLFNKFVFDVLKGIRDSSAIQSVGDHHDLGHIGVDGKISKERISDTIPDTEEEQDEEFRRRFDKDEEEG